LRTATAGRDPVAAYLGLGSNLGDRRAQLAGALRALGEFVVVDAISSVYATDPVGYREQPEFWNLAARVRTSLPPPALLARVKALEAAAGRTATFRDAPRSLDIDILLYGEERIDTPELVVPHPRMLERRFVLVPLAELDPELAHPVSGRTISAHLADLPEVEGVRRLFPGLELLRVMGGEGLR
jgi:2-amino-4-hydroxy-6-hydroxymethyldihydropteridine diphosphokinase